MSFQFLCPQGHLLEGDESQQGQPCDCPTCGTRFLIPVLHGGAAAPQPEAPAFPDFTASAEPQQEAPVFDPEQKQQGPRLLHIPCPNGHELETPDDMLGQEVLCPLCGEQFALQYKNSVEAKIEREKQREQREAELNQIWFKRAIIAAVIVVAGLIVMAAMMLSS